MNKNITIAVDGYSSCGKSTLAKSLAKELRYIYVDTGAMYRAVTLYFIRNKAIDEGLPDIERIKNELDNIQISFKRSNIENTYEVHLNNENIEYDIRLMNVSNHVSAISKIKEVRKKLVVLQQQMGRNKGVVMDGRDIGTVVFPNAEVKIFMTANVKVRAKRRYDELVAKGMDIEMHEIIENIESRDYQDTHRKESPLQKANDAIEIDNTLLNQQEQLILALDIVNRIFH